nr:PREDICTED: uncharacterized protein LOC109041105 isoform X1 [Bemisia tabaci]
MFKTLLFLGCLLVVSIKSEMISTKYMEDFKHALKDYGSLVKTEKDLLKQLQDDLNLNTHSATTTYLSFVKELYLLHEELQMKFEKIQRVFNGTRHQDFQNDETFVPLERDFIRNDVKKLEGVNTKIQKQSWHLSDDDVLKLKGIKGALCRTGWKLVELITLFNEEAYKIFQTEAPVTQMEEVHPPIFGV